MIMGCKVCKRKLELRLGVCFDCAGFESLIDEGLDMHDNPVKREIQGSDSLNILYQIIKKYKDKPRG
jgi:hypothetical protein